MTININEFLLLVLYIVLIILVITFIVVGIKLIKTLNKADKIMDDVNIKINKVDGVFDIIDRTTDFASSISDKVVSGISSFINLLLRKKKGSDDDE